MNIPEGDLVGFRPDDSPSAVTMVTYRAPMPEEGVTETYHILLFRQESGEILERNFDSKDYSRDCEMEVSGRWVPENFAFCHLLLRLFEI